MKEFLKWLQGLGVAALMALYDYVQSIPTDGVAWKMLFVMILVRAFGWLVSKLPA